MDKATKEQRAALVERMKLSLEIEGVPTEQQVALMEKYEAEMGEELSALYDDYMWERGTLEEVQKDLPHPHNKAIIVFGGEEMPYSQNVDNLGENGQNKSAATGGAEVVVKGDEFGQYKDIKELRAKALQYYADKLQGTSVENKVLGSVNIDRNGIVNFTRSGKGELKNSSAKEHKLLLVKYLPDLIRDATNITDKPSEKQTHKKEHFYYLHTQASVEGKTIPVEITLIRRNNGEIQYYNHILPSEENKKDVVVSTEPVPGNPAYGPPSIPTSFGNQNIPRDRGNVNEKPYSAQASESRSDIQGGFSDGEILNQDAGKVTRGRIWRDRRQGKKIIQILATADRSTFLHEMGHLFLMDLEDLAAMGDEESQRMLDEVDDWAKWQGKGDAKKYVGTPWAKEFADREAAILEADRAGDLLERDSLIAAWRHERWARAWEIYLMEGTAPSKGLRAVFKKFKSWLRKIYDIFISDGARASKDVEKVMARLVASEEEIERMEADARYTDFEAACDDVIIGVSTIIQIISIHARPAEGDSSRR